MANQYSKADPIASFWRKVDKRGPNECWEWAGTIHLMGYGRFCYQHRRYVLAHRFSFELANGPLPPGLHVCHRCDNPPCVNPAHLFSGTQTENMADMRQKGRGVFGQRNSRSKLSDVKVNSILSKFSSGVPQSELAREYGVSHSTIHNVVRRKKWTHIQIKVAK